MELVSSKAMPSLQKHRASFWGWCILFGVIVGVVILPWFFQYFLIVYALIVVLSIFQTNRLNNKLRKISILRKGWNIGNFAREFDRKIVDTKIIRAVYEEIYEFLKTPKIETPLSARDNLSELLDIDDDSLDEIIDNAAFRCGRDLKNTTIIFFLFFFPLSPLRTRREERRMIRFFSIL